MKLLIFENLRSGEMSGIILATFLVLYTSLEISTTGIAIATRHMTYLLEVMFDHCSDTEKTDFSSQLSVLTSRHPGKFDPCIACSVTLRVFFFSHEIAKFTSRFSHLTNF